jgi:hypothetical protein
MGVATGVDLETLLEVGCTAEAVVGYLLPSKLLHGRALAAFGRAADQVPPESSTDDVRIGPCSVITALTRPASVSSPRAAQPWWMLTPCRRAACANAGAAVSPMSESGQEHVWELQPRDGRLALRQRPLPSTSLQLPCVRTSAA